MFQQRSSKNINEEKKTNLEVLTFLGIGTEFKGKVLFQGTLRIDGKVEGEIDGDDTLLVGESGVVNGTVKAGNIQISGKVKGDIRAGERLTLKKGCDVRGTIFSRTIVIEEGAVFNGTCRMDGVVEIREEQHQTEEQEKGVIRL
ncbi:MAG: polymer-forming cytoskeletal protein [Proteobacteria bacterium]|nr:polymer-forming cytoskeletal protein [Pseudomonadota bacterium]